MSREYCDHIIDLLNPWHDVIGKRMFGGYAICRNNITFGLIFDDTIHFKVGGSNRADYESEGSEPFTYEAKGKRISVSFWQVPAYVLDDPDVLMAWADKAYAVASTAKKAPSKTNRLRSNKRKPPRS